MNRRKWIIRIVLAVVLMLVIAVAGVVVWASTPPAPMPEAIAALQSGEGVAVETDARAITFVPAEALSAQSDNALARIGVIFYPGGRVDARAYAPLMDALAAQGVFGAITPMPLNLAVLNVNAADAVIAAHPQITSRVIAGHSLGGSMAARYARDHAEQVRGLILLAAYPEASVQLQNTGISVLVISASNDGLTSAEDIAAARPNLPEDTTYVVIEGGNHAQFGWYGDQAGDGQATISREDQQAQVLEAIEAWLNGLERNIP